MDGEELIPARRARKLKTALIREQEKVAPGAIHIYDLVCVRNSGSRCADLLLTRPTEVLASLVSLYGGDKESAVIAFKLVFLKPLEKVLGAEDLSDHLLELVKTGRDREFIEAIAKAPSSSKTAESNLLFTLEI
ncbi:MAG: hypothetical protein QXE66_03300 [Desulfurococcaceae archaeon]